MKGNVIKGAIKKQGFTIRQVAGELGMSEQSLHKKLSYDDVSSLLMEQVTEVIGMRVWELYGIPTGDEITAIDHSTAFHGTNACDTRLLGIIESRDRQLDKCQEQIDRLIKIVENGVHINFPQPTQNSANEVENK